MSVAEIDRFQAEVKKSTELQDKIKGIGSDAEAIAALAKGKGYNFTGQDLIDYANAKKGELSDEDLDKVAGGGAVGVLTAVIAVGVVVAT